ncbi:hypothetical protein K440DRAFT_75857 [Wilcoxina mikolae CBS 423.85]|nr:hypothetical protein K440DRAFT_75857 [Wilcoxina mikolae CBS 423.85]
MVTRFEEGPSSKWVIRCSRKSRILLIVDRRWVETVPAADDEFSGGGASERLRIVNSKLGGRRTAERAAAGAFTFDVTSSPSPRIPALLATQTNFRQGSASVNLPFETPSPATPNRPTAPSIPPRPLDNPCKFQNQSSSRFKSVSKISRW